MYVFQEGGCGGHVLMEERLMMQQQQMEDDQRWLEQEEGMMVRHTRRHTGTHTRTHAQTQRHTHAQEHAYTLTHTIILKECIGPHTYVYPWVSLSKYPHITARVHIFTHSYTQCF